MKRLFAGLVAAALLGCAGPTVSADALRHALLVAERVQAVSDGAAATVESVVIRDIVIHDARRIAADAFEADVTYTAIGSKGAVRRDRRVFIRELADQPVLVGECLPGDREHCDAIRHRTAQG